MGKLYFVDYRERRGCGSRIQRLYSEAFPKIERVPLGMLKWLAHNGRARLYGIYDETQFVGMMYAVYDRDIVFVFYLAVDKALRGRRYGSRILWAIRKKYSKRRIILNIEEADPGSKNYAQRIKRKEFYERNGFRSLNYTIKEAGVTYEMMCCSGGNKAVSKEEYMGLLRNYLGERLFRLYKKISK